MWDGALAQCKFLATFSHVVNHYAHSESHDVSIIMIYFGTKLYVWTFKVDLNIKLLNKNANMSLHWSNDFTLNYTAALTTVTYQPNNIPESWLYDTINFHMSTVLR